MDELKINLSSLLSTQKHGMKVSQIPREYYEMIEEKLPFRELGYSSPEELLKNTPGFILYRESGELWAKAMANEKTVHLHDLIAKQKSPSRKRQSRSHSIRGMSGRRPAFGSSYRSSTSSSSSYNRPSYSSSSRSSSGQYDRYLPASSSSYSKPNYDRSRSSGDYGSSQTRPSVDYNRSNSGPNRSQSRPSNDYGSQSRSFNNRPSSSSSRSSQFSSLRQLPKLVETPSRPITVYEPESAKKPDPPPPTTEPPSSSRPSRWSDVPPTPKDDVSSRQSSSKWSEVSSTTKDDVSSRPSSSKWSDVPPTPKNDTSPPQSSTRAEILSRLQNKQQQPTVPRDIVTYPGVSAIHAHEGNKISPLTLSSSPIFNRAMMALNPHGNRSTASVPVPVVSAPVTSRPVPVPAPAPIPVPAPSTKNYTRSLSDRISSLSQRLNINRIAESQKSPPIPSSAPVVGTPAKPQDPRVKLKILALKYQLPQPRYRSCSGKAPKIYSQLEIGTNYVFKSYPQDANSEEEAQIIAAEKALVEIENKFGAKSGLVTTQDERLIGIRVFNIICDHASGVFEERIPVFYEEQHHESLPMDWNKVLDSLDVTVDVGVANRRIITKKGPESMVTKINRSMSMPVHISSPPLQKLPASNLFPANISKVLSTTEVWGRPLDENDDFRDPVMALTEEMNDYYSRNNQPTRTVEKFSCYAIESLGEWQRVRVEEVDKLNGNAIVFYIDLGDEDTVDCSLLCPLNSRFLIEAPMAIRMSINSLEDMSGCDKVGEIADSLMFERGLYVEVLNREVNAAGLTVISGVFWDTSSEEAGDININQEIKNQMIEYCQQSLFKNKKEVQVQLSNIDDNGNIYLQAISEILEIINIMIATIIYSGKINEPANAGAIIDKTLMYLVKNPEGEWVRAKIIQIIDFDHFKVLTIDYGLSFEVKKEKLRCLNDLNDSLVKCEPQASIVRLNGIEKLDDNMIKRLNELAPKNDTMTCKIIRNNIIPVVDLITRNPNDDILYSINLNLLALNNNGEDNNNNVKTKKRSVDRSMSRLQTIQKLRPPFIPSINKYFEVCVAKTCSNPNNFVVQPYESRDQLKIMMAQLNDICESNIQTPMTIDSLQVGNMYAAKHDDGQWYRACLYRIQQDHTLVVYHCDYGGIHLVSVAKLQSLNSEFYQLPYQAIRAELVGIKPKDVDWDIDTCLRFRELVVDKCLYSVIKHIKNDETGDRIEIGITLIDTTQNEDINIHEVLVNENKAEFANI